MAAACTELFSVLVGARLTCAARPDASDGVIVPFFADNESIAQLNLLRPCDPFKSHSTHALKSPIQVLQRPGEGDAHRDGVGRGGDQAHERHGCG